MPHILKNTRLITLSVGGNDMGFAHILKVCANPFNSADDDCREEIVKNFGEDWKKLDDLGDNLDILYSAISAKAPLARVAVIGYPELFKPAGSLEHCGGIQGPDVHNLNLAGKKLNHTIHEAAKRHPAFRFVNLKGVFVGHGPCQDHGPKMWINPLVPEGERLPLSAHPNKRGQRVIAKRVAKAFPNLFG
jgi:lysophospholipase L1-like esterase